MPGEWAGARLGWTGSGWALRKRDGSLAIFRACGPGICSIIIRSRDAGSATIYYRRDRAGRLLKMDDGKNRWIAFDYDDRNRIARAYGSNRREVRYDYDDRGRLSRVRRQRRHLVSRTHLRTSTSSPRSKSQRPQS